MYLKQNYQNRQFGTKFLLHQLLRHLHHHHRLVHQLRHHFLVWLHRHHRLLRCRLSVDLRLHRLCLGLCLPVPVCDGFVLCCLLHCVYFGKGTINLILYVIVAWISSFILIWLLVLAWSVPPFKQSFNPVIFILLLRVYYWQPKRINHRKIIRTLV